MDDIVIRPRYPRHSVAGKKRKKYSAEKSSINILLARQIFISLLILILAFAIKNINSPLALTVQDKIKYVLTADSNIGDLLASIEKSFSEAWNSKSINGGTSATDGQTSETSGLTSDTSSAVAGQGQASEQTDSDTKSTDSSSVSSAADSTDDNSSDSANDNAEDSIAASGSGNSILMVTAPVKGELAYAFGERTDPVTGNVKMHEGIDIEVDKEQNIVAALGGTVTEAGSSKNYGNYIKIKHQGNLETVYAHCSKINVKKGQTVKQGQVIAIVGSAGATSADNLHFEVWSNGKAVNPLDYVSITN